MPSGVEHLDVIGSLPPDNVNPASIMGSQIVPDFFKWARENYDRIVIDSPPFGIVGDVVTLAAMVDSVMINASHAPPGSQASPREEAKDSALLPSRDADILLSFFITFTTLFVFLCSFFLSFFSF